MGAPLSLRLLVELLSGYIDQIELNFVRNGSKRRTSTKHPFTGGLRVRSPVPKVPNPWIDHGTRPGQCEVITQANTAAVTAMRPCYLMRCRLVPQAKCSGLHLAFGQGLSACARAHGQGFTKEILMVLRMEWFDAQDSTAAYDRPARWCGNGPLSKAVDRNHNNGFSGPRALTAGSA